MCKREREREGEGEGEGGVLTYSCIVDPNHSERTRITREGGLQSKGLRRKGVEAIRLIVTLRLL